MPSLPSVLSRPAPVSPPEPPVTLPPGRIEHLRGRGEVFLRDTGGDGPTVLLLHGWMFHSDLNWWTVYDALADPAEGAVLAALMEREAVVEGHHGVSRFHWTGASAGVGASPSVRAVGVEQSNSSIIFDDRLILKVFRRLEPGDNPELEMLRFLSDRGFENIPALAGWYEFEGELLDATLGVLSEFVADGRDGWEYTLGDPEGVLGSLSELGVVTGEMHTALASDAANPGFAPEEPGMESLSLLTATIDEEIERLFVDLPEENEALRPILGRGEEVRDRL